MTDQSTLILAFAGLALFLGLGCFFVGRWFESSKHRDDLRAEFRRGHKAGYDEGRKVIDLGKRTQPVQGQGYTSNTMKRAGH